MFGSNPRTAATQSLSSVLLIRVLLSPSTYVHGPFLSPPSKILLSSLYSAKLPLNLSLLLLPPLRPFVVYFPSSPWAPVVTRRSPVGRMENKRQTDGEEARGGGRDARANWLKTRSSGESRRGERGRDHVHQWKGKLVP